MGKYKTVVSDPPWPIKKMIRKVRPHQKELDYKIMTIDEIRNSSQEFMAPDCHVFLWATQRFLPVALKILQDWDVRYVCVITWVKPTGMTPFSWMFNTEFVVYGIRGTFEPLFENGKGFDAPNRGHSVKPVEFYRYIRTITPAPRIDLFARQAHEGFDGWGDEYIGEGELAPFLQGAEAQ